MSQSSLNQTIQSYVTDPNSDVQRKGIFKISENQMKRRPGSALPSKGCNDALDNASIGTTGDLTRTHKLGHLPSYLKKQTKSSVESELVNKHKKFKFAKKELIDKQTQLINDFEHLQSLKEKFKQFGGRDYKLEMLKLVEFTHYDSGENAFGDEIQSIRKKVKDCLFKLVELNADAFQHIQTSGTEALQNQIREIFSKVEDYVKTVSHEQDTGMQCLLDKLQQLKCPDGVKPSTNSTVLEEEIVSLRKAIQNLEVQSKMLQSEIDVKSQEIEYLKNKEAVYSKSKTDHSQLMEKDEREQLMHSEIESQQEQIKDYQMKLNKQAKLQEALETKVLQLETKISQQELQNKENLLKFESNLYDERRKCKEFEKMLEEMKDANTKFLQKNGSSFELMSNQLASAREDIKQLQFKISKRDKQIQNLKQTIDAESNKTKNYDQLLLKYDELQLQDQCKAKEMLKLQEKLILRTDTIDSQNLSISDLQQKLTHDQSAGGCVANVKHTNSGSLQNEHQKKFLDHERIIKKLQNNKIRSNALRDQLLERISMLEKENDDMKAQIRKFHEDFTINRFMHDEQRRKRRLTEILVKQYQK